MKNAFVIFGPAKAGKSTLLGYLLAKLELGEAAYHNEIEKHKKELGLNYSPDRKFSYFVDKHKDEKLLSAKPKAEGFGTSLYSHLAHIHYGGHAVTIEDTPGREHNKTQRLRAQFYGNIGLFTLPLNTIEHLSKTFRERAHDPGTERKFFLEEFLSSLFAWINMHRHDGRLIIVFSKSDQAEFSEEVFSHAKTYVEEFLGHQRKLLYGTLPIYIDVAGETDANVINKSSSLHWFRGVTLADAIKRCNENELRVPTTNILFVHINKFLDQKGPPGLRLHAKVVDGCLAVGDIVRVAPVSRPGSCGTVLTAKVRELRTDGVDMECPEVTAGNICVISIQDLKIDGKSISKTEVDRMAATCLFAESTRLKIGNLVRVRGEFRQLALTPLNQTFLLWCGRQIPVNVLRVANKKKNVVEAVFLLSGGHEFSIPVDRDGNLITSQSFLWHNDKPHRIQLLELGRFKSILFNNPRKHDTTFRGFSCHRAKEAVEFDSANDPFECVRAVLRFQERYSDAEEEALPSYTIQINEEIIEASGNQPERIE